MTNLLPGKTAKQDRVPDAEGKGAGAVAWPSVLSSRKVSREHSMASISGSAESDCGSNCKNVCARMLARSNVRWRQRSLDQFSADKTRAKVEVV